MCMAPIASSLSSLPTCSLCIGVVLLLGHGPIMPPSMAASPQANKPPRQPSLPPHEPPPPPPASAYNRSCEAEFERLQPLEPLPEKLRSEAGTAEYFDEASRQLRCVGAFVILVEIDRQGLAVPRYTDDAGLAYALKGRGIVGYTFPGCPETYYHFKQGDVFAIPPGVPFWIYNDGDTPLELILFFHESSCADELERKHKEFVLGGSNRDNSSSKGKLERVGGRNVLSGFSTELLSESIRLDTRLTRSLQGQSIRGFNIVRVQGGLALRQQAQPSPTNATGVAMQLRDGEHEGDGRSHPPDEHDQMCRMKLTMNLEDPAGIDSPQRITILTGRNFPILNSLQVSVERGILSQDAAVPPHYTAGAQSVVYVVRGSARVQVVDNTGAAVFDGELGRGQLLVVPEFFVVLTKAGKQDGVEYAAFKTGASPVTGRIAGPGSVLRGLPVGVVAASYNVSAKDAMRIRDSGGN